KRFGMRSIIEIKHSIERTRFSIEGEAANSSQIPVVFNKAQNRRLIGDSVIDKISSGEWRDNQQGQARTITTAILEPASRFIITTLARPIKRIISRIA